MEGSVTHTQHKDVYWDELSRMSRISNLLSVRFVPF